MNDLTKTKSIESITRAEFDVQISTAKRYPRNVDEAISNAITLATLDEETAISCFYCLGRQNFPGSTSGKKTEIKGGSVRLSEIISQTWGNLHAATRIVDNNGKTVTAQAVAWDLEKNVKITTEISRRITKKDGKPFSEDMQIVTANAAAAIALRNAIFKVIPKSLTDKVYNAALNTALGKADSLEVRRQKMINYFAKFGVSSDRILASLNKNSLDEIGDNEIKTLLGRSTAIKDGTLTIEDAFPFITPKPKFQNKKTEGFMKDSITTGPVASNIDGSSGLGITEKDLNDLAEKNLMTQIDEKFTEKMAKVDLIKEMIRDKGIEAPIIVDI